MAATKNFSLPALPRGRPSAAARERYDADCRQFAKLLLEIDSRIDFKASSRGWGYILENDHGLAKGDFDRAQDISNDLRKNGMLPIDFTADDGTREASNEETLHDSDPAEHAGQMAEWLRQWEDYRPVSFWDNQHTYVEVFVEKIDLK